MEQNKFLYVLDFYYETCKLKEVERSGWIQWGVLKNKRRESIAEHVYGTQQLALTIYAQFKDVCNIDIYKVIAMLACHETEEILIGDYTPADTITEEEKLELGKNAVEKITKNLEHKEIFKILIDEFNERKTDEAKFAYLVDKLECLLQAKKYSDEKRGTFETASKDILQNEKVQKVIKDGAKDMAETFIFYHEPKFAEDEIFKRLVELLKTYKVN
ncbi:MAG: HD domain-containing protein [Clostridia bacterium]|nr:HD domain-containing protein [Clostridia bacterium]